MSNTKAITVITGIDDLIALPVGVKIQDRDGDVYIKTDLDTYTSVLYTLSTNYLVDYLPAVVLDESIEFEVGDEVKVISEQFFAARVAPGDFGKVVEVQGDRYVWVKFSDDLHIPFKKDEISLVRRNIESARKTSDEIIDLFVEVFRKLLDRVPTAGEEQPANLPPDKDVLITSVEELNALPDGSVVSATIPTSVPTRYKDRGHWRVVGESGTFDYTTAYLARSGKLRLVYRPIN